MRTAIRVGIAAIAAALMLSGPAAAQAPNDNFENAAPIGPQPATVTGSLLGASHQDAEPDDGTATVWYVFRPTADSRYALELRDFGNIGPYLGVFTGPALSALTSVAQAEYWQPRVAFDAVAGATYWVAVGDRYMHGPGDTWGAFSLRLTPASPPSNDAFADAKPIKVARTYTGTLADASGELGEPVHAGRGVYHSVWFRFRAPARARLTFDTGGSGVGTTLVAYTGTDVSRLRVVARDATHSPTGEGSVIRFIAQAGTTYRIAVDSFDVGAGYGEYRLYLSDGGIKSKGIHLGVRAGQTVASIRRQGLRTTVSALRKATVRVELVVTRRVAHRLGLSSHVLGSIRGVVDYGQKLPAVVTLTPAAKKALKGRAELSATLRLTILNTITPNRVLSRAVILPM